MADADSLHDVSSDLDKDSSAVEADAEDEAASGEGAEAASRKKSKKKKRKPKDTERSSGDSDNQMVHDELHGHRTITVLNNDIDNSPSGMEADSEGQASASQSTNELSKVQSPVGAAGGTSNEADAHLAPIAIPDGAEAKQQSMNLAELQKIQKALALLNVQQQGTPKSFEEASKKRYQFWETQPVPQLSEKVTENGCIEEDKPVCEVKQEPYNLPTGFQWDTLDINDPLVLKELYTLLNENYVEDDDNMFRFDYSSKFLQWALLPPGWRKEWHCGVRVTKNGRLVGFISAIPVTLKISDKTKKMVEINFLCVHKKLRSKRMAPVLIKEITRRVNLRGLFQAVYTAGVVLPKPVACCRYWHRSLNPRKLIDVKFSHLSRHMTMQRMVKLHRLPDVPKATGFRAITPADVGHVHKILTKYLDTFDMSPVFCVEDFKHWFMPRPGIVDSYVIENGGKITDFISFYTLKSTVMQHASHKDLKAAYSFYNVSTKTPWDELMTDALITAKNLGFDVFNALDLMDNKQFLEPCKFGIGDGYLQYYLYNWKCPPTEPTKVGLVLQ